MNQPSPTDDPEELKLDLLRASALADHLYAELKAEGVRPHTHYTICILVLGRLLAEKMITDSAEILRLPAKLKQIASGVGELSMAFLIANKVSGCKTWVDFDNYADEQAKSKP